MSSTVKTFADFDVDSRITQALSDQGITTPFPIQELTLPLALSGADLIGQARTGTGKTLAFGLPLLQRVDTSSNATQALIIVPTRELCLQVHDDLVAAGTHKGVSVVAAYGGRAIDPQSQAIAEGAEVVVGTPGRLLDLMRRGLLQLSTVSTLVLDEADEMLDMGFLPDVEQLIEACAEERQTLLFSATMPAEVVALARRYMRKPTFMRADVEESRIAPETRQHFFAVHRMDKPALVARILRTPERGRCVIFTRTKRMADMLVSDLRDAGLNAAAIHSDLRQEARERTLARFRTGQVDVMCATEVAARGLDIDEVTHVINYDCPDDEKMYLHRIGRTGRAGAEGVAVTLAIWSELARLDMIKKALDVSEPTLEVFSTSDVLDELFPLPTEGTSEAAQSEAEPDQRSQSSPERSRDRDAESDDDRSAQRAGGRSSRRRRRGGRGRSRPAETAGSGGAPERADAEDVDARSDVPAPASTDAGAEAPEEARPGPETRRPSADRPKAAAAPARGPGGSPAGSGPEPLRRTRRRTRTVGSQTETDSRGSDAAAGVADQQPAEQPSRTSGDDQTRRDGAGTRRRERTRTSQPRGDRGNQSQAGDEPETASAPSRRGESGGGGAKQQGGGRGGRRGGRQSSAGRGRRRSEPSRGSGSGSSEGHPRPVGAPAGVVAAADARGEGRPGLRRLVRIDHLP